MKSLYNITEEMAALVEAIEENGGELTAEMEAAWDDSQQALVAKADGYTAVLRSLDDRITAIKAEKKRLQELQRTTENTIERIKAHIVECMTRAGIDRIDGETSRMSLRRNAPALLVDEEMFLQTKDMLDAMRRAIESAKLPPYIRLEMKVDKSALKYAFPVGVNTLPAGCAYESKVTLNIK